MRVLASNQHTQVSVINVDAETTTVVFETDAVLLEAPNWHPRDDALVLNGDGGLWHLGLGDAKLRRVELSDIPAINNDHLVHPDGVTVYLSADDGHLYRAPIDGGSATRVTHASSTDGFMHFLHGIRPDGARLAFVGVRYADRVMHAPRVFTMSVAGDDYRAVTPAGVAADGPEYHPSGEWIYLNTEQFDGHAQIARVREDGLDAQRLTHAATVDWFPHLSPDHSHAVYLAYPPGTTGHPPNCRVNLMLVERDDWQHPRSVARLFGGQGTINVNSWSPNGSSFAFVAYPVT
jgi:Tol biopolymer transport system component